MFKRIISLTLTLSFLLQQTVFAYSASLNLSGYLNQGHNLTVSDRFRPINLRYFSYQPLTNDFKILLDKGDTKDIADTNLKGSASVLLDYFKIGLSLPNDKFWVNLRPDSEDEIIDDELAKTDLGKVMLEADLKLKQDTSLFTSPNTPIGKTYWDKLYKKAGELFGTENITIPTLTRPWIVPGEIILRESKDSASVSSQGAYIYKANLKVMLEEDYLKNSSNSINSINSTNYSFSDSRLKELNLYSTQLIRELILPKLTQKVNSSKDYANLRQVYFSLILARWFKETFNSQPTANSPQNDSYIKLINSNNLSSLTSKTPWDKTTYFNAYQKSFQEGEYNLSEPIYTPTGQVIRRYMSGGTTFKFMPAKPVYTITDENTVASAIESKGKVLLSNDKLIIQKPTIEAPRELTTLKTAASAITVEPEIAFDSRGKKTVAVTLKIGNIEARGDVPAGASKGEDEARTVGAENAIKNINDIIVPLILEEVNKGRDLSKHADLLAIEKMIIAKAGDNYAALGADAVVPVSRALWVLAGKLRDMELAEYIRKFEPEAVFDNPNIVFPYMNIYNGGLHAAKTGEKLGKDRIDFQEIMIVPVGAKSQKEALAMGDKIDFNLKQILSGKFAPDKITRADEAGFSVKGLGSSDEAIEYVFKAIERAGYKPGVDVKLALDTAATSFYNNGKYEFQGKMLSSDEMINYYVNLVRKYAGKIISIEDGLAENDWDGWTKLTQAMEEFGVLTIGDDNFVTQLERLEKGIEKKAAKAILIKVNQNGSMSGTLEVIKRAKKAGFVCIVSHRSGETLDTTIADLAYGVKAFGLKTGDPQPAYDFGPGGEYADKILVRRAKYKRMIYLEEKTTSSAVENQMVYFFGNNKTEAEGMFNLKLSERKDVLGGKGESVHSMTRMTYGGVRVPPGFTITTEACKYYYENSKQWPPELQALVDENLKKIEENLKRKFGDEQEMPLFVSVRSGAKFSMPGMMDTVLNVGSNDKTIEILAKNTNDPRFAWDSYRRFIQMFGATVFGISKKEFEEVLAKKKTQYKAAEDKDLTVEALKELVAEYKDVVKKVTGREMPQDVREQLRLAISAVFESWNNERAIAYRNAENIPHDLGTAVTVQSMVFGNRNNKSGTGVGFTRNPSTGEKISFGEFLINAQGEDVVAGIRTPEKLEKLKDHPELAGLYEQLIDITTNLEKHYKDMLDFEFTIEDVILYLLQARAGKRTATAAVKIAVDLVKEGIITKKEALERIKPESLDEILFPHLSPEEEAKLSPKDILAVGLPAGPGAGVGQIVFHANQVGSFKNAVLLRQETSPDDVEGMRKARAIVTAKGGMTSHAAVVGRGMGKVVMVGAEQITVDEKNSVAYIKNEKGEVVETLHAGDWVTVSVSADKGGRLIKGEKKIVQPTTISPEVKEYISWAKEVSNLRVRANGDTPEDAKLAKELGAEGIGLTRTEHMFFAPDRLPVMQEMILNLNDETKMQDALNKLLPMQRKDFAELFEIMEGYPVTIRTLDPPLHEFLPKREIVQEEMRKLSKQLNEAGGTDSRLLDELKKKMSILELIDLLHEINPMLGTRGARLGILMPAITKMQARAIAEAAVTVIQEGGKANVEIMIPLIGTKAEFVHQKTIVDETIKEVMKEKGVTFTYKIGTMIEVPRAALTAGEIAEEAEFFSFGTNDLTQMTLGLSRDDTGPLISLYRELGIYPADPFEKLDQKGVGKLVTMAVNDGRRVKPDLKTGVCGEHGGNPDSIEFFHKAGLDYVSMSPYRILGAWLAAAQAQLKEPAPLTIYKLKAILEKMQSDNYSLYLKNKPELGRKIEVSQVVVAKNKPALVIEFGDRVTVQDIMGYISMRPEAQQIRNFFEVKDILKAVEEAGMSLPSSSSAIMSQDSTGQTPGQAAKKVVGGIDFRQMNMLIQPQGSFASSSLDFSLPALSKAEIESFDLDQELAAIQKMASSGIAPSYQRLKEYLAVCFAQERTGREIDSLKLCLLDVFEQQQLEAKETPDGYKEVLVIADTKGYVLMEDRLAAVGQKTVNLN